jgi:hypothetical protein
MDGGHLFPAREAVWIGPLVKMGGSPKAGRHHVAHLEL